MDVFRWAGHVHAQWREPQPLPQQQQPPVEAEPLLVSGAAVKVSFFGVGEDDVYLKPTGIGLKRGPTGKGEYTFSKLVSLNISDAQKIDTIGTFANYILEQQLGGSVDDLCSQEVKVVKVQDGTIEALLPFDMIGLDAPIVLDYKPDSPTSLGDNSYKVKLVLYLRAKPLCVSRAAAARANWTAFKEGVAEEGMKLSENKLAALVGLSAATIKTALSPSSQQDGAVRRSKDPDPQPAPQPTQWIHCS